MKRFLGEAKLYGCPLQVILIAIFLLSTWCGNCLALGYECLWLEKGPPDWFSAKNDDGSYILVFVDVDKRMAGESITWVDCCHARVTYEGLSNLCMQIGRQKRLGEFWFFCKSREKLANLDMSFLSGVTNLHSLHVAAETKLENFSAIEVGQLRLLDLSCVIGIDDERCIGNMRSLETFVAPLMFSSLDILPCSVTNLRFKLSEANANKSFGHLSDLKGLEIWTPKGHADLQSRCVQKIANLKKLEFLKLQGDWTGVCNLEFLSQMPLRRLSLERVGIHTLAGVDLRNLEYLAIEHSSLRSSADIGLMPKLRELVLLNSPICPISPSAVANCCPSLEVLTCDGNISGEKTWVLKRGKWELRE